VRDLPRLSGLCRDYPPEGARLLRLLFAWHRPLPGRSARGMLLTGIQTGMAQGIGWAFVAPVAGHLPADVS
jgi:hypothetical protein